MTWRWWSDFAKRAVSSHNINISINRTTTINGKEHKCKKDPCPVCAEIDKAMEHVGNAMDHVGKAMDSVSDAVDKVSDAVKDEL